MPTSTIFATNKRKDIFFSPAMFVVTGICVILIILSLTISINYFATLSLFFATIALLYHYTQPPQEIKVTLDDSGISLDGRLIQWEKIVSWDELDLGDYIELSLITKSIQGTYTSFYLPRSQQQSLTIFRSAMNYYKVNRQEGMATSNTFQNLLRILGLR
jgi:hypothetical protein